MLADYAVRVENSRGRRHPEPPHPYRNDFQRDRDRVVHARAFRRLEAKTQVFTRRYSDHFRNRLTNTIEIAYTPADLDDGYEARLLTVEQIAEGVDLFKRHYSEAKIRYPNAAEKLVFNEALKSILDGFVGDLIVNTAQRVKAAGTHSLEDVRRHTARLAAFSPSVGEQRRRLKDFLYGNLYYSPALAGQK